MKKKYFMISFLSILFLSYTVFSSSQILEDDFKSFGYHYGVIEKIRERRQTIFLEKNQMTMEKGYKGLADKLQYFSSLEFFIGRFLKGCRQTENSFGRYTLIKNAEDYLEENFHTLQMTLSNFSEENKESFKRTLLDTPEKLGIYRGGEILYGDQKARFNFLRDHPNLQSHLLTAFYESGKQMSQSLKNNELLSKYEESGASLMNIYHKYEDFLPKGQGMKKNDN